MKRVLLAVILYIFAGSLGWSMPTGAEIIQKLDAQSDFGLDITAKASMTQVKSGEKKVYESLFYRRDKDDSFLIIMTAPEVENGKGYLKIGDNFWMYLPNTGSFQQVNRDESISGTDSKGGDFEKRKFSELYQVAKDNNGKELVSEELLANKIPVYKIEVTARVSDVTYPKQIVWLTRDNFLTLKTQSYSLSGTLMQTAGYNKYFQKEGKWIPLQQIFIDEFEKGNKTLLDLSEISFEPIRDDIFTKAYLKNRSK